MPFSLTEFITEIALHQAAIASCVKNTTSAMISICLLFLTKEKKSQCAKIMCPCALCSIGAKDAVFVHFFAFIAPLFLQFAV